MSLSLNKIDSSPYSQGVASVARTPSIVSNIFSFLSEEEQAKISTVRKTFHVIKQDSQPIKNRSNRCKKITMYAYSIASGCFSYLFSFGKSGAQTQRDGDYLKKMNVDPSKYPILDYSEEAGEHISDDIDEEMQSISLGPIVDGRGSLITDKVRLFSSYNNIEVREKLAERCLQSLLVSSSSIEREIYALQSFISSDRTSTVYILRNRSISINGRETYNVMGKCDTVSEAIFIYISSKVVASRMEMSYMDESRSVILHEIVHKAIHKLGWHLKSKEQQMKQWGELVSEEIASLNIWQVNLNYIIERRLKMVAKCYDKSHHLEEYLCRTMEIIYELSTQGNSSKGIQAILRKHIPNLYRIFCDHFLKDLEAYNRKLTLKNLIPGLC